MPREKNKASLPQVGVLCYSLMPATVDLLNRVAWRLEGARLVVYPLVKHERDGDLQPAFDWHPTSARGRDLTLGGEIPDSQLFALQLGTCRRLASASQVVVLLGIQSIPAVMSTWLARLRRRPVITVIQTMPALLERRRPAVIRALKRYVLRRAAHHIAQTPGTQETLERVYGLPADRISYAPFDGGGHRFRHLCEQPVSDRSAVRAGLGIPPDVVVFACVATLIYRKGVDLLLKAFAQMRALVPADRAARLWIIGPDGGNAGQRAQLERLAAELGIAGQVRFFGAKPLEELVSLYRAADVFLLPTRKDVWPKVLVEAALCGLPLITTDASSCAHTLVRDGENGYVVPSGAIGALRQAMSLLLQDGQLRQQMGVASRRIVAEFIDPEREADVIAGVVSRMLTGWPS